ncbi:ABC transporter permease [Kitasatospora xanthocidica]|uniref:FtsX-like permease family protein n=1 Tax=Kitasatospora xanthocidica TaxID=83382 RepID=UPI00167B1062|nr:FtsX-like permease family protein [Kitasatospora xanthocidica]GHF80921.1 ABC transporter permease [Kitasatospora xanthocidica]
MFRIAMQSLAFRKGSFLASFISLFFGATILLACGGLMETGIRGAVPPQRLAAAPLVVTGDQHTGNKVLPSRVRLTDDLVTTVQHLPGVQRAVPDVSFPVVPLNGARPAAGTDLQGHGWSAGQLAGYTPGEGGAPNASDEVLLDTALAKRLGVRTGDKVQLAVAGRQQEYRVSGVATGGAGVDASAFYFSDRQAAELLGHDGRVDSIAVVPSTADDGALRKALKAAVAGKAAVVLSGDDRGTAEFPDALAAPTRLISMSAVFGGIAVLVAVFVVGSTLALLAQQRQREMALLRAIGTTPQQVRRMVVGETLVIALAASLIALLPGWFAGEWMLGRLQDGGVIAPQVEYHEGWIPMLVGGAVSLLSAVGAAFIAARGAARARPAEALAEAALQRRWLSTPRLLLALLCFAGGTALAVVTSTVMHGTIAASTAGPSAMLWAGGLALIGPGLTRVLTAVLHPVLRGLGGLSGYLAVRNAKARRIRVAGAVTPVMLATGLATALIYLQTSQALVAHQVSTDLLGADAVVSSATGGMAPQTVAQIAGLPGVRAASPYLTSEAFRVTPATADDHGNVDRLPVTGVAADAADKVLTVRPTAGSFDRLTGDSVVLPTSWTAKKGQEVGGTVTLQLGDGASVPLRVVGSFEAKPGFDTAFLPAALMLEHSDTGLVPQILVSTDPGTSTDTLRASLGGVGGVPGSLRATELSTAKAQSGDSGTSAWINYLLAGTIVGYAVISLVNTLIISASERRREFALQRLVGSTTAQILRMMAVEALLVAVSGAFLGTLVGVATLVPFSLALNGSPWPQGSLWIYLAVIGSVGVLTFAATLLPTRMTLRTRPAEVIAAT